MLYIKALRCVVLIRGRSGYVGAVENDDLNLTCLTSFLLR